MNNLTVVGNLASDAKVFDNGTNKAINFTVICNMPKKEDKPLVFTCSYWSNSENLLQYLKKGQKVAIGGSITKIEATTKEDRTFVNTYVRVSILELAGSKGDNVEAPKPEATAPVAESASPNIQCDDLPF